MSKRISNEQFYKALKNVVTDECFGIHAFGELHEIAKALGWDEINSGGYLHELWSKVIYYTRKCIKAGYPIKEGRIKCCSWSPRETWHPIFWIEE